MATESIKASVLWSRRPHFKTGTEQEMWQTNLNSRFPTLTFFICYMVSLELTANSRPNSNGTAGIQQTR